MAADWQTVSKRLYTPEEREKEREEFVCAFVCVYMCVLYIWVLIVFFHLLTCLFMCYVCADYPSMVGWESDNSDAVREAVSTEVKSYGCQW